MSTGLEAKPVNGQQAAPQRMVVHDNSQFANLLDTGKFEHLWRVSKAFAASELVPAQFQGKPENCFIGIQMAIRLGVDPFMFLQSCYIVHGRPGIEAKLAIALANSSGLFVGPIRYELTGTGNTRQCTAYAMVRETGERIEMTVDWKMVEAEGWSKKSGSKWLTIPEVMFRYRSAMLLIRTHCPEVIVGMVSKEELEDVHPQTANRVVQSLEALEAQLAEPLPFAIVDPTGAHAPIETRQTAPEAAPQPNSEVHPPLDNAAYESAKSAIAAAKSRPAVHKALAEAQGKVTEDNWANLMNFRDSKLEQLTAAGGDKQQTLV